MRPNFFLVGTTKGGTSSLHMWLSEHPEVATPQRKEMHFFCRCPSPQLRAACTLEEYLDAFPSGRAVGESSPCYLYYPETPERLAEFSDARIIISLRDPVERFWSHYLMNQIYRPRNVTAEEWLSMNLAEGRTNALEDLYGMGLYGEQLQRYLRFFPMERVMVAFLEETAADPAQAADRIQRFLGLGPVELDTSARDKEHVEPRGRIGELFLRNPRMRRVGNALLSPPLRRVLKTKVLGDPRAKPPLPADLRSRLEELYADDSRSLELLLQRSLPWDWHSS